MAINSTAYDHGAISQRCVPRMSQYRSCGVDRISGTRMFARHRNDNGAKPDSLQIRMLARHKERLAAACCEPPVWKQKCRTVGVATIRSRWRPVGGSARLASPCPTKLGGGGLERRRKATDPQDCELLDLLKHDQYFL
jgi:hypothetical protein